MRLTLVIASLSGGGAERVMAVLAEAWAAEGHRVTLITLSDAAGDRHRLPAAVTRVALDLLSPSAHVWQAVGANARRLTRLRRAIRDARPEVVISFLTQTNVLTLAATRGLGVPVIVSERIDPRAEPQPAVWAALRRALYRRAAAIVVQTTGVAQWIERHVPAARVHTIPNPVPAPPPAAAAGPDPEWLDDPRAKVLAMGRLTRQKGFDVLLRAFAQCRQRSGWSLVILGEGEERGRLEALAGQLGIAGAVTLPGYVPDAARVLARGDLFVLSSRYEGFPNALLETMAAGLPVIATDCPSGPADIVRDGVDGVLVPPDDVGALSAAMGRLMSGAEERIRLGARARDVLDRFSPKRVAGQWNELLAQCAGSCCMPPPADADGSGRVLAPTRIALLIDRLNQGGAERQFVVLAAALRRNGHTVIPIVFYPGGPLAADLRAAGLTARIVGKRGRWDVLRFGVRLARILRHERPHVLLAYAGAANIVAAALKPWLPRTRMVWGVRASNMELRRYGLLPRLLGRVAVSLSRTADLIIANSVAGRSHAVAQGYPQEKIVVIPNGIDTGRFAPSRTARTRARRAWSVEPSDVLIGLVGRIDPMKDHRTFLEAAAILATRRPAPRFVCIGDGPAAYRDELQGFAVARGLQGRVSWLPGQIEMPEVYNALDVLCSSSAYGEGFPNVLGEAMACGLPCVVTDVGDSARILDQPRFTVPAGDARALAARVAELLDAPPEEVAHIAAASRRRIVGEFSIAQLVRSTEQAVASLAGASWAS